MTAVQEQTSKIPSSCPFKEECGRASDRYLDNLRPGVREREIARMKGRLCFNLQATMVCEAANPVTCKARDIKKLSPVEAEL